MDKPIGGRAFGTGKGEATYLWTGRPNRFEGTAGLMVRNWKSNQHLKHK
jgi:hypothetical protein